MIARSTSSLPPSPVGCAHNLCNQGVDRVDGAFSGEHMRRPKCMNQVNCHGTPKQRFWRKVDKNGPIPEHRPELGSCWIWTGAKTKTKWGQHGHFFLDGKHELASRVSWMLHDGPIPQKIFICHHCDNPICVRPSHLFKGTPKDNTQDCVRKRRHGMHRHPESSHGCTITPEKASRIKQMILDGVASKDISATFGVGRCLVSHIKCGKTWRHLAPFLASRHQPAEQGKEKE